MKRPIKGYFRVPQLCTCCGQWVEGRHACIWDHERRTWRDFPIR